jgi:hypothetical protein
LGRFATEDSEVLMRQLTIRVDTPAFQAEMKRSGNGKVPPIRPSEIGMLSPTAYILIGDRTPEMGGGLAGTGYVIQNGKATHSIAVNAADVHRRLLRIPQA